MLHFQANPGCGNKYHHCWIHELGSIEWAHPWRIHEYVSNIHALRDRLGCAMFTHADVLSA
jgi:hypothetical protein